MPKAGLLAVIDDIIPMLDDIATLTKMSAKKTSGIIGDDLAVNAEQLLGVEGNRELQVVKKVAIGSLVNKAILVPSALAISAVAPAVIPPLLMLGGAYLCYEALEKVAHKAGHKKHAHDGHETEDAKAERLKGIDAETYEKQKIKGAVRTDFILSAEIVAITLGAVAAAPLLTQAAVMAGISLAMTVGVYSAVAGIVRADDVGLRLSRKEGDGAVARMQRKLGHGILYGAPYFMKALSIGGTAAMFMVGGGILAHGVHGIGHGIEHLAQAAGQLAPVAGGLAGGIVSVAGQMLTGVVAGAAAILGTKAASPVVAAARSFFSKAPASALPADAGAKAQAQMQTQAQAQAQAQTPAKPGAGFGAEPGAGSGIANALEKVDGITASMNAAAARPNTAATVENPVPVVAAAEQVNTPKKPAPP